MGSSFYQIYQKDVNSGWLKRLIFGCFNSLFKLDKTIEQVELFENRIGKEGISRASEKFIEFLRINLKTSGLKEISAQEGYLFFGNHPTLIDPLVLISIIGLDDIKFFSGKNVLKIGSNLSKHIFPIKNMQIIEDKCQKEIIPDWIYRLFFKTLVEFWDRKEAINHNQTQVEKAADFLANGGKFLIFPIHQPLKRKDFRKGIGFILSKAKQKKLGKKIKIVPFYIKIKHPNLFSLWVLFKFREPIDLEVIFGEPVDTSAYQNIIKEPKRLALKIQRDYQSFLQNVG